jgi:hypothetical protein
MGTTEGEYVSGKVDEDESPQHALNGRSSPTTNAAARSNLTTPTNTFGQIFTQQITTTWQRAKPTRRHASGAAVVCITTAFVTPPHGRPDS